MFEHRPSNGRLTNIRVVSQRLSGDGRRSARAFVARLVGIRFRNENQRLDRDENLQEGRCRVPLLFRSAVPGVQNAQTNFSVVVQIRIETHGVISGGFEIDRRWRRRIFVRKVNVEEEITVRVRRSVRAGDQHAHDVHSVLIGANEDRRVVRQKQRGGNSDLFLRQAFDALHRVDRQCVANDVLVMIFHSFVENDFFFRFAFHGDREGAELERFHRLTVDLFDGERGDFFRRRLVVVFRRRILVLLLFGFDFLVHFFQLTGEDIQLFVVVNLDHRRVCLNALEKFLDQTLDVARLTNQMFQLGIVQQTVDEFRNSNDGFRLVWNDPRSSRCANTIRERESNTTYR